MPSKDILIIETRDDQNFQVRFSALDFKSNTFLWKEIAMKEQWWIGMTASNENTLLLHTYANKGNPDHKNLIAFDIFTQKNRWEVDEFSFFDWGDNEILGYRTDKDWVPATVTIETGEVKEREWDVKPKVVEYDFERPVLYVEGLPHFETVRTFLAKKTGLQISKAVEYLEHDKSIIVSLYIEQQAALPVKMSLANYLYVFDENGEVSLHEKLGENLQGLGVDTFFMLSGCLFLVKNKSELAVFSVYD